MIELTNTLASTKAYWIVVETINCKHGVYYRSFS